MEKQIGEGYRQQKAHRLTEAEESLKSALKEAEDDASDPVLIMRCLNELGAFYKEAKQVEKRQGIFDRAKRIGDGAASKQSGSQSHAFRREYVRSILGLANIQRDLGRYISAAALYKKAQQITATLDHEPSLKAEIEQEFQELKRQVTEQNTTENRLWYRGNRKGINVTKEAFTARVSAVQATQANSTPEQITSKLVPLVEFARARWGTDASEYDLVFSALRQSSHQSGKFEAIDKCLKSEYESVSNLDNKLKSQETLTLDDVTLVPILVGHLIRKLDIDTIAFRLDSIDADGQRILKIIDQYTPSDTDNRRLTLNLMIDGLQEKGDFNGAINLARKVLTTSRQRNQSAKCYFLLGRAQIACGDINGALDSITHLSRLARSKTPELEQLCFHQGAVLADCLGANRESLIICEKSARRCNTPKLNLDYKITFGGVTIRSFLKLNRLREAEQQLKFSLPRLEGRYPLQWTINATMLAYVYQLQRNPQARKLIDRIDQEKAHKYYSHKITKAFKMRSLIEAEGTGNSAEAVRESAKDFSDLTFAQQMECGHLFLHLADSLVKAGKPYDAQVVLDSILEAYKIAPLRIDATLVASLSTRQKVLQALHKDDGEIKEKLEKAKNQLIRQRELVLSRLRELELLDDKLEVRAVHEVFSSAR